MLRNPRQRTILRIGAALLALAALIGASAEGCKINPGKSADGNGPTTAAAPAPTQPQQNQPTHPIPTADNGAPPKIPDYSSGGTECTFYSEGNATSIELSADGNTLIGTVLITCVPLPKELRIFIKMYALPAGSTVWRQLGQDQVWTWPTPPELPPETFPPLNPIHIERPCAAGRYFITYNVGGIDASGKEMLAQKTFAVVEVPDSACGHRAG